MVTSEAPRAFNREMYHDHPENVFYGTDDGAQDGSFSEFAQIKAHYENVAPERRENIHMISVVGGLYGLNLIPLWKPTRLTIFDVNPTAVSYFKKSFFGSNCSCKSSLGMSKEFRFQQIRRNI